MLCFLSNIEGVSWGIAVVAFAKGYGQVKFESPRTQRVRRLLDFASLLAFLKTTIVLNEKKKLSLCVFIIPGLV